jgi:hypothetical protein
MIAGVQLHPRKVTISRAVTCRWPAAITSFPSLAADPLGCYTVHEKRR